MTIAGCVSGDGQRAGDRAHPGGFVFHPLDHPVEPAGGPWAAPVVLGGASDDGKRFPQAVAGIIDALAHACLAAAGGGRTAMRPVTLG
jgi:hypothetical protein